MTRPRDNVVPHAKVRSLRDAIRKVKFAEVERTDVVVELRESERARLELLAEELQDTKCVICWTNLRAVVFLPCKHRCCCEECGATPSVCPMCRAPVQDRMKVYG